MKFLIYKAKQYGYFITLLMIITACGQKTELIRGMYYWQSAKHKMDSSCLMLLEKSEIQRCYVHLFDVKPDPLYGAVPDAKTHLSLSYNPYTFDPYDSSLLDGCAGVHFIPTVFVRNDVFEQVEPIEIDRLAGNIAYLCDKYFHDKLEINEHNYDEIQLDCDWTSATKDAFFKLIAQLKETSGKKVSCTLRLYPFKYREKMGIPPADRVTLMCYNYFNPLQHPSENSIQNNEELKRYLQHSDSYPIPIDVALPIFSYTILYHNNEYAGIIYHNANDIMDILNPIDPLWYEVEKDTNIADYYLVKGDKLKIESCSPEMSFESIDILKDHLDFDKTTTLSFFHLSEQNIKTYSHETLNSLYLHFAE
ncbi:hypothetical protein GC194_03695 [bacterium]|nr:hypothetical protein [bacterium]